MKKFVGSLLGAIISGVVIYWLTVGWPLIKNDHSKSDSSSNQIHPSTSEGTHAADAEKHGPPPLAKGGVVYVPPPPSVVTPGKGGLPAVATGGAVIVQAPPASLSRMGPLEPSTNRQGSDIGNQAVFAKSPEECSENCARKPQCRAMTFVRGSNGGACWLKFAVPGASVNSAMVSAVKR